MHKHIRYAAITLSVLLSLTTAYTLAYRGYLPATVVTWILSVILFLAGLLPRMRAPSPATLRHPATLVLIGVLLLPAAVRILHYSPTRIHGDDLLTAYFSLQYRPRTTNFFTGIPQDNQWVSAFPTPYFLLQKIALGGLGASVTTVTWSVLPYILIVSVMLFLIARRLMNLPAAVAAVWLYAFLAPSIYLETLGLHFISSTAFYLLFFYMLIRALSHKSVFMYAVTGVVCGACYLFYTSSYIALPVLLLAVAAYGITRKSPAALIYGLAACAGFWLTFSPFAVTAATTKNYFLERVGQVSLINGEWSAFKKQATTVPGALTVTWNNLVLSSASLIQPGIGGHGGYTFDNQAFFTLPALAFFLLGSATLLLLRTNRLAWLLVALTVLLSFLTGMVLTIPPPAFHRLSLAYPFIALISAIPVYFVTRATRTHRYLILLLLTGLFAYAATNVAAAHRAIVKERTIEDARLITYINATFPGRNIHVAAYPTFALEKLYFFFTPKTAVSIDTQYHNTYLRSFNRDERYVYVILYPDDFEKQFEEADPSGRTIRFSEKYSVFVNY